MAKVIIVYESKYGNTRLVAEKIAEGIKEISGMEAALKEPKEVDSGELARFDAILVGSPNHMGSATRGIRKFIDKLGKIEGKAIAVFDTYLGQDYQKAIRKMEQQITKKAPDFEVVVPGLSVRVEGMKGPVTEEELPKCREFGAAIAKKLQG